MTTIAEVERTLDEILQLGGTALLQRWPVVGALRAIAAEAAEAKSPEREKLLTELKLTARSMWGGYGSFTDYGIGGPQADRFERLKDQLSQEIGAL